MTKLKKDRYIKVSAKWWNDTETGRWIHDDNIHKYILPKTNGTQLGKNYKNSSKNKMY